MAKNIMSWQKRKRVSGEEKGTKRKSEEFKKMVIKNFFVGEKKMRKDLSKRK